MDAAAEAEVTRELEDAFGATRVVYVDNGLLNDHTDGHIDTLARFVAPGVVLCMAPSSEDDPNRDVLEAIARDLGAMRDARGRRIEVVRVPSPGRVLDEDGRVMPASYANFYIANGTVVVPTYGSPRDDDATAAIARAFPSRTTIPVYAKDVLRGGGAFHCITQQQPAPNGAKSGAS